MNPLINLLEFALRRDIRRIRDRDPDEVVDLIIELGDEFGIRGALTERAFRRANLGGRRCES